MIHKIRFNRFMVPQLIPGRPVHVNLQDGEITAWYEVGGNDTYVRIMGTGQEFPVCGMKYINTFFEGEFVWHAYALPKNVD